MDSPGGLCRARSPADKHFGAIYTVKQPYKIHIDVYCILQKSACMQSSVTFGRTDAMDYRPCIGL